MESSVPQSEPEAAAVWVAVDALKPWKENPRHNEHAVSAIADSIERFGFGAPIVARANGEIIAGHTRFEAAKMLGLDRVPVRYMDLDPAEAHLLALADNKLAEISAWAPDKVAAILSRYSLEDVALTGWDSEQLEALGSEILAAANGASPLELPPGELRFEETRIAMTQDQTDRMKRALDRYVEENGTLYGAARRMLRGVDRASA